MRKTSLRMVHELAAKDDRIVFVGSDLGVGTMAEFQADFPDRFFMEGIAEANMIGLAAGLAMDGYIPYVNTIATFLTRRALEQVAVDLCMHNLRVRLIGNGGGLVYAPLGPTHLAIEDLAVFRTLPNMTILCPCDADEMARAVPATVDLPGPVYIRLGKGGDPLVSDPAKDFTIGRAVQMRNPANITLISTGVATTQCLGAAELLARDGLQVGLFHFHTVKPLDIETIAKIAATSELIVSVEEHILAGGLGSAVLEALANINLAQSPRVVRLGLPDAFPDKYGSQADLMRHFGIDAAGIAAHVRTSIERTTVGQSSV